MTYKKKITLLLISTLGVAVLFATMGFVSPQDKEPMPQAQDLPPGPSPVFTPPADQAVKKEPQSQDQPEGSLSDWQTNAEIILNFQPFLHAEESIPGGAMFVVLRGDGKTRVVHYSPNRLVVLAVYQGILSEADVRPFWTKTGESGFREALQVESFAGTGFEEGDPFYLSLKGPDLVEGKIFGLLQNAPEVVRALVKDLLVLWKRLDKISLADAYVRGEPIRKERFDRLRQRGQVRFASLHEFPSNIQPRLAEAIDHPYDFIPLQQAQYDQLLTWRSDGHELFVINDNTSYQLSLFRSQN